MNYYKFKKSAISLREKGFSYSEINRKIPVSKSTLSLWLRNIQLNETQKIRLKILMKKGQPYAAKAQKKLRLEKTEKIISMAKKEIGLIDKKTQFYLGIMLYWAEGSKQKIHHPSERVILNNSDPRMIRFFLNWLTENLKIDRSKITFQIYSHDNIRYKEKEVIKYWSRATGYPKVKFDKIYYKRDKRKRYRKNQGKNYYGLLRVIVSESTDLNRKISGWIEGVYMQCGVV